MQVSQRLALSPKIVQYCNILRDMQQIGDVMLVGMTVATPRLDFEAAVAEIEAQPFGRARLLALQDCSLLERVASDDA